MTARHVRRYKLALRLLLVLLVGVALIPYTGEVVFDWLHIGVSIALFALAYLISVAFLLTFRDRISGLLVATLSISGAGALASQVGMIGLLLPTQIVFLVAFGTQLTRSLARLPTRLGVTPTP